MPDLTLSIALFVAEGFIRLMLIGRVLLYQRRPASRLSWVLVLLAFPLAGTIAYLFVGEVRLGRDRRRRHDEIVDRLRTIAAKQAHESYVADAAEYYRAAMGLAEAVGGMPVRRGHELQILGETDQVIESLVADIDAAQHHCHLLFYIFMTDSSGQNVARALERAAQRGVACRLLVDAVGSSDLLCSPLADEMRGAGVTVVAALPANLLRAAFARLDLRNHRKIAVIDGQVGWTGSQNVADAAFATKPRFAPWVDCMLRIVGPAVRDLQEIFLGDWFLDAGESLEHLLEIDPPLIEGGVPVQVVPTGPGYNSEALQQIVQAACHEAHEELIMTTPYFVPGEAELAALTTAARRGVHTMLVVPQRNDSPLVAAASRSRYSQLLDAGIEIHEYTKGLLHAKTLTIDRAGALVGTANFDRRSFELNFEVSVLVYDSDVASQLRFLQREYMADSVPINPAAWAARPRSQRLRHNAAGVLSPLL